MQRGSSHMDVHDQPSADARASRMKFVWPMAQLTATPHPSELQLTLTSAEGHRRTLSPKDLLHRLSREFRKKSEPSPPVALSNSPHPEPARAGFPNTELAMRTRPSLLGRADELLARVFAESLAAVAKRRKAENKVVRERRDVDFRRRLFPTTASVRLTDGVLYSTAAKFVDRLIQECDRRVLSMEGHRVRRLASYKTPEEFTIDDGVELVLSWLSRWPVNRHWFVKVVYNGRNLTDDQHTYYYTARLSVPTLAYPVAQVTCDITFTVDVTRMSPPPVHVDVWYRVETDRSHHSALANPINQEWIENVVRWKLRTFKMFTF